MSVLFAPATLSRLELPNRIVIAPMCQYSAHDGCMSDWHVIHLGQLALSGAGLLIIEATGVEAAGRISPGDVGLYNAACEAAMARVLTTVRRYSEMPIGIQLAHAGRKASSAAPWDGGTLIRPGDPGGWQTVAPSAVPHGADEPPPQALDEDGLARIRDAFADAARRAVRLGLDLIEVHSAHGYLLHQFLSPLANRRGDAYGGSLENRLRFPLEVFDAVRAAVPASTPVGVRISASDWAEGGWDLDQSLAYALARGMLYDPRWPWHAAARLGAKVRAPRQYWRSEPAEFRGLFNGMTDGKR